VNPFHWAGRGQDGKSLGHNIQQTDTYLQNKVTTDNLLTLVCGNLQQHISYYTCRHKTVTCNGTRFPIKLKPLEISPGHLDRLQYDVIRSTNEFYLLLSFLGSPWNGRSLGCRGRRQASEMESSCTYNEQL
jgi:hypothetical protein